MSKLLEKLEQIKYYIGSAILIFGVASFYLTEGSRLIKVLISLLTASAIYLFIKKSRELVLIVASFLAGAGIYGIIDAGVVNELVATIIFLFCFLVLFYLFTTLSEKDSRVNMYFALLAFLSTELFVVLKYFPIDGKNKAILLTLLFWYFSQIYFYQSNKKLKSMIVFNLTLVFIVIFAVIVNTLPFIGR